MRNTKRSFTNKIRVVAASSIILVLTAGCSAISDESSTKLRTGVIYNPDTPTIACGFNTIKESQALADAGVEVSVSDSGQLGTEEELIQQVGSGQLDFGMSVGSIYAGVLDIPDLEMFETYYLYEDVDDVYAAFDTDVASEIWSDVQEETGLVKTGEPWLYGARHMFGSVPVRDADDLKGVDVRVPETDVSVGSVSALGANPTSIAYGELFLSLQQGVVSLAEAPLNIMAAESFDEASSYVSLTNHLISANILTFNEDSWNRMNDEQQKAIETVINKASEEVRKCVEDADAEALEGYKDSSDIEVITDVDTTQMREKIEKEFVPTQTWKEDYERLVDEMKP